MGRDRKMSHLRRIVYGAAALGAGIAVCLNVASSLIFRWQVVDSVEASKVIFLIMLMVWPFGFPFSVATEQSSWYQPGYIISFMIAVAENAILYAVLGAILVWSRKVVRFGPIVVPMLIIWYWISVMHL